MSRLYSILVIVDDPNLRYTLAMILARAGYVVTTAVGAQDGLRNLEQMKCDLIFIDAMMPDVDSRLLLHQLRQSQPTIPVIALAEQASPELAEELSKNDASGFLITPVAPECILAQVHALLIEN
jgi:CheY-like chemotaxis protein